MRWDRLFADLIAAVEDDHDELHSLLPDLIDENWSGVRWCDHLGGDVDLEVVGVGRVRGRLSALSETLIHLRAVPGQWFVARSAVEVLHAGQRTQAPPSSAAALTLTWPIVLRALREEASIELWTLGAQRHSGRVHHVGADYVALDAPGGNDRTGGIRRVLITLERLAAVRVED